MLRVKTGKRSMWSVKLALRWNIRHGKAGDYVLDDAEQIGGILDEIKSEM